MIAFDIKLAYTFWLREKQKTRVQDVNKSMIYCGTDRTERKNPFGMMIL
jgi:hypothetical protein